MKKDEYPGYIIIDGRKVWVPTRQEFENDSYMEDRSRNQRSRIADRTRSLDGGGDDGGGNRMDTRQI